MTKADNAPTALRVLKQAIRTKSYAQFLKDNGIRVPAKLDYAFFRNLPPTSKSAYIKRYPLKYFFSDGRIPPFAYASSGSSGKPTFWFRGQEAEDAGADMHETVFTRVFGFTPQEPILCITAFYMGIWVGGNFTNDAIKRIGQRKRLRVTSVTPGADQEKVIHTIAQLGSQFKHKVLFGYPDFIIDLLPKLAKQGLAKDLRIVTAGYGFSEAWRQKVLSYTGQSAHPETVLSFYGLADLGLVAAETEASIVLKKAFERNPERAQEAGIAGGNFGVFQYNPKNYYVEAIHGKLAFTASAATPLVRYTPGDFGQNLSHSAATRLARTLHLSAREQRLISKNLPWPFLIFAGREDVSVIFYAMYVHPEHIQQILAADKLPTLVQEKFMLYKMADPKTNKDTLHVQIALQPKQKAQAAVIQKVTTALVKGLSYLSFEYRTLYDELGTRVIPQVQLVPAGAAMELPAKAESGIYFEHGRKPKIVRH